MKEYKYEEKGGAIKAVQLGGVSIGLGSILVIAAGIFIVSRQPPTKKESKKNE